MTDAESPQITAYLTKEDPGALEFPIISAFPRRDWMYFRNNNPYHCLPLTVANQMGWLVLNPIGFTAEWEGEEIWSSIRIEYDQPFAEGQTGYLMDHFGNGVLTWGIPYLFRTSPGYNLLARGPANWPKDGIQALEGLVETDWTDATFTMNWKFTRAHQPIRFEQGEPFCMIVPMRRGENERFEPSVQPLSANPALHTAYRLWTEKREKLRLDNMLRKRLGQVFNKPVTIEYTNDYMRGRTAAGDESFPEHQTQIELKPFRQSWQSRFYQVLNSARKASPASKPSDETSS